jgi:hypothetical protein
MGHLVDGLVGFPLDDVWHRLFGQDVTPWGPTHLMLIGGAAMALVGLAVLLVEAVAANAAAALASGIGIGTLGLATEWGWTHVWMPLPWPTALAPGGVILGFALAWGVHRVSKGGVSTLLTPREQSRTTPSTRRPSQHEHVH